MKGYRAGSTWITPEEIALHHIDNADKFAAQWIRSMMMWIDSGSDIALSLTPKITAPVLLMLGKKDALNPRSFADKFLEHIQPKWSD